MNENIKTSIKKICPPILFDIKNSFNSIGLSKNEFSKWWKDFKSKDKFDPALIEMVDNFIISKDFFNTSDFWLLICRRNLEDLAEYGIENFKQVISAKVYWGEKTMDAPQIVPLYSSAKNLNIDVNLSEVFREHKFYDQKQSIQLNISNIMLLNWLIKNNYNDLLDNLEEHSFGNPVFLNYKDKKLSQDVMNSVIEYRAITEHLSLEEGDVIIEVGGGSGRTAACILSLNQKCKYIMADIPPALFLAKENLKNKFKDKIIFHPPLFENFQEIKDQFDQADIIFLFPEQLKKLPPKIAKLCIAIDCLHEMTMDNINYYFNLFDTLGNYFYFKCQLKQWAKTTKKQLTMNSYPIMSNWDKAFHDPCVVPGSYFHALYLIN